MQVIIIGTKRAEICPVRRRNQDKELFARKAQLYRVFPDDLVRCKIEKWGRHWGYEEVVAYEENQTVPMNPRVGNYGKKEFFAMIRRKKIRSRSKWGLFATAGPSIRSILGYGLVIVVVAIVLIAVLTQGAPII